MEFLMKYLSILDFCISNPWKYDNYIIYSVIIHNHETQYWYPDQTYYDSNRKYLSILNCVISYPWKCKHNYETPYWHPDWNIVGQKQGEEGVDLLEYQVSGKIKENTTLTKIHFQCPEQTYI